MENYKKKYEDALERAKICHKDMSNLDGVIANMAKDFFEEIFPELRESDDERNWKILKSMIHANVADTIFNYYKLNRKDFELWLEKQKEKIERFNDADDWKGVQGYCDFDAPPRPEMI